MHGRGKSSFLLFLTALIFSVALAQQDDDDQLTEEQKICSDKSAGELFRLKTGDTNCRNVVQCTAAVSTPCPHDLTL